MSPTQVISIEIFRLYMYVWIFLEECPGGEGEIGIYMYMYMHVTKDLEL